MVLSREKINIELAKKNWSVTDLAKVSNLTRQRVNIILNSRNITPKTVSKIAKALGVDVTEIIETEK